jgi:CDP-glycerol glycerophosphotransferase
MTPGSPPLTLSVDSLTLAGDTEPRLELSGSIVDAAATPTAAHLVGHRLQLDAAVVLTGSVWSCSIPLLASRWGGPRLAPPSGEYRLELTDAAGTVLPLNTATIALPPTLVQPHFLIEASVTGSAVSGSALSGSAVSGSALSGSAVSGSALVVTFAPPLDDAERGPAQQARLEAAYRAADPAPLPAVFFESFYGQIASCNPLAIDRELAARRPDIVRYWSVADASVVVPPGSIALIEGSAEWWRVRGAARLIVVNDWLRKRFRARKFQTVLQTWHGTPLKRIALSRRGLRPRAAVATLLERSRWNILLAQNRYSTRIFRTAYAYLNPTWEEGYPRNDRLLAPDAPQRAVILRTALGIPATSTVVMYAPTWRDDRPDDVDQLDVAAFARELGPDYTVLIRGHSRSLRGGSDVHASNVLDVTSYPDVSDLFLVSDALVTDYSSVMFDYTVTGKPLYFYTPDLDRYRGELRGFYFDLLAVSPGPVVRSAADLIAQLRDPDAATATYAARYRTWRERFNTRDDGHASARVVDRLLSRGALG